ncbi:Methyltransferase domain-containing protein [Sinosporangium album]|uniref:Methyltransferase domain-containing protein n=1 Tax=Sinosporangium album TaxID=504805 RepID=A0A1G7UZ12_9ACTN|nr:class I SAM-dependent methyltransferase [Sinosporangium album]SDG52835.1 Methyltransferase domain-containing protein [Sinosporangium album]
MAALGIDEDRPPDTGRYFGGGMEQFHHPRPVRDRRTFAPTPERAALLSDLTGTVLEIGSGDGVKAMCYPPGVTEIILVEPDPFVRETARHTCELGCPRARVVGGDFTALPVADATCSAVVCSLALCRADTTADALAEIRRVLRPGGRLRFYEHAVPKNPVTALATSLVSPLWRRACGGCRPDRDPVAEIRRAGFTVEHLQHLTFDRIGHVLGSAVPGPDTA